MEELSPYDDLLAALRSARHPSCQLNLARRVIEARAGRGDYEGLIHGELTTKMRDALAEQLVEEMKGENSI